MTGLIVRGAGLILLLVGIIYPWVLLEPLAERAERIGGMEQLVASESVPRFAREWLIEIGYTPGLTPEQLWALFGRNEYHEHFDFVEGRERLHSWDFLRVPTSWSVKTAVLVTYLTTCFCAASLLVALRRSRDIEQESEQLSAGGNWHYLVIGSCLMTVLLVLVTTPLLDTFGHFGRWGLAWLDVLSGARATISPRALLPLGLLLLLVGELLDNAKEATLNGSSMVPTSD